MFSNAVSVYKSRKAALCVPLTLWEHNMVGKVDAKRCEFVCLARLRCDDVWSGDSTYVLLCCLALKALGSVSILRPVVRFLCAQTRSDAALFLFGFVSAVYTNGGAPVGAAVLQNRRSKWQQITPSKLAPNCPLWHSCLLLPINTAVSLSDISIRGGADAEV